MKEELSNGNFKSISQIQSKFGRRSISRSAEGKRRSGDPGNRSGSTESGGKSAIAIARGFVAPGGIDLVSVPAFTDIEIEGEERTAIKLIVEPR